MTQITEDATLERDLTGFWDVLRTASCLIAALAMAAVVATTVVPSEPREAAPATMAPPAPPAVRPERQTIVVSGPQEQALHIFYLVQTPEQEELVHWTENEGAVEASNAGVTYTRQEYDVLYARSEEERQIAALKILEKMLDYRDLALVGVIDMRPIGDTQLR